MKTVLHLTAINLAKLTSIVSQMFNAGAGTSLPGKIASRISPDLFSYLVRQTKKQVIFVTGTNGKTTTSGLIAGILNADNRKLAHNRKGANMTNGLITALCKASSVVGKLDVDNCLLEIDEAYLPLITEMHPPHIIALTNLFRDQLDRYGELDTTAKKVLSGINKIKNLQDLTVIVNADDPITCGVVNNLECKKIYYGIDNIRFNSGLSDTQSQKEIASCKCGKNYSYNKTFYSHLGHYYCDCGEKRPFADILATNVEINVDSSDISLVTQQGSYSFTLKMPGLYNVYNALCAISIATTLNIDPQIIKTGIKNYSTVFGRAETVKIRNKNVLVQLIKNPVGATEVLKTVAGDPDGRLIIAINDNYADGRDVSWLWDAEFEILNNHQKQILCSGVRASDMAVRLKYAGINPELISVNENIKDAIETMVNKMESSEKLYILPTYTVLLDMQLFMSKLIS